MQLRECCFFFQLSEWTSYSCMTVESVVNFWSVSSKATVWILSCEEKWIWNLKYWCFVIMGKLHWCDDWLYSPFILMRFLSWELQKKKGEFLSSKNSQDEGYRLSKILFFVFVQSCEHDVCVFLHSRHTIVRRAMGPKSDWPLHACYYTSMRPPIWSLTHCVIICVCVWVCVARSFPKAVFATHCLSLDPIDFSLKHLLKACLPKDSALHFVAVNLLCSGKHTDAHGLWSGISVTVKISLLK